ncbi:MAG: NADH-quinone oxidoreductase subunit C, partial [Spartobacteria bacterium]|nr:NADH-quinone oxidoreductase subunit C [Spartobacteria bacterium]
MNLLTPQQIAEVLQTAAGAGFVSARCTEWAEGVKGRKSKQVWLKIARESLIPTLKRLVEIQYPHVAVIASADTGAQVELMYHFYVYWGIPHEEILVTFTVALDKTDLKVPTITGLIPGALTSEREKQEMVGIEVVDIPDGRRLFLPEDFPNGVYPWRNDETGIPPGMIK